MTLFLQVLFVLLLYVVLEFAYARYTIECAKGHKPLRASAWCTVLVALSGVGTIQFVSQPWLLIPACIGAFVGTFAGTIYKASSRWQGLGRTQQQ